MSKNKQPPVPKFRVGEIARAFTAQNFPDRDVLILGIRLIETRGTGKTHDGRTVPVMPGFYYQVDIPAQEPDKKGRRCAQWLPETALQKVGSYAPGSWQQIQEVTDWYPEKEIEDK